MDRWIDRIPLRAQVLLVLAIAISPVGAWLRPSGSPREAWLLYSGLGVQLIGFLLVWLELRTRIKASGMPGLLEQVFPRRKQPEVMTATAQAAGSSSAIGRGRWRQSAPNGTVEERLAALETNQGQLDAEMETYMKDTTTSVRELDQEFRYQVRSNAQAVENLMGRIRDAEVGSVNREWAGLIFFLVGCIASTLAVPLSTW